MSCERNSGDTIPPTLNIERGKRIGLSSFKSPPEVFNATFRGFENTISPNAPRVLTPEAVIAESIPSAYSH